MIINHNKTNEKFMCDRAREINLKYKIVPSS